MKWFLIGLAGVVCSTTWVRGDAAGDLYKQGVDALGQEQYDVAVKDFDQIITGYPNTPNIDDVRMRAGFAYLHLGDFANAIDRLKLEAALNAKPEFRATGLYFTGLAQFSQGQKLTDKAQSNASFGQAAATLTTLIDYITKNPTPDNQPFMEDTIYYRSLAQYQREDYADAEKDLLQLLQAYPSSLKRPDYLLLLGSLYAVETNQTVTAKATPDQIKAAAQKSLDTFDKVTNDPNALVQANDANMSKAEVLYLIAQLDAAGGGYQTALDAFRLVRRKDDMVQIQQARLDQLKKASANALQSAGGATLANENVRLIDRESGRLAQLKDGPDPIIQALIRIAECYNAMKPPEPDEARTVLRRLSHTTLTPQQQQEVDFQLLDSYVFGGQTDKADAALTDYLTKHPADPQADGISFQIAGKLIDRKDNAGALAEADRSLKDFPNGRYVGEVITLKAQALTNLGKVDDAKKVLSDYAAANKQNPAAIQMMLIKAQGEVAQGDLTSALDDYQTVKSNSLASPELQAVAAAGHIQVLQSLQKYDDVIAETKDFASKYPDSKALAGVLVFAGLAMDRKNDPAAITALQDVARKYPTDEASPFALFYVVTIYQRTGNVPAMIQAANDLSTAYPTAYTFLGQAADLVGAEYVKEKKFDLAVALYQPLVAAPKPDVAAAADNKVGAVWLAAAKAKGSLQSLPPEARAEPQKWMDSAEQSYLTTLQKFPDQLDAVGDAFQGLTDVLKQRRSGGLLTDLTMEDYLAKLAAGLTTPDMQTRVELAKAGLVFIYKNGDKQYPAALDRFKKAIDASPSLVLTRQEASQFGELLIAAQDYPKAIEVYTNLLSHAAPDNAPTQADGDYGLGATYLAQGDVAKAAEYFARMKALPGGAAWNPHIQEADYGLASAAELSGDPNGLAKQTYANLMKSPAAGIPLQAKSMLGYGRLLEKAGYGVAPAVKGTTEFAVHYYLQVDLFYSSAVPELSAEGLFDAGQAYEKASDNPNAKAQYKKLISTYGTSAPDWTAKAQAASDKLGP